MSDLNETLRVIFGPSHPPELDFIFNPTPRQRLMNEWLIDPSIGLPTKRREAAYTIAKAFIDIGPERCRAIVDGCSEIKTAERRSNGGKVAAARRREARQKADPNAWMTPIFDEAYKLLEADGSQQRGRRKLVFLAHRVAGPEHPDHARREEMKDRQADTYLKKRRKHPR